MPEGPEVRRYADELADVLAGHPIKLLSARTKNAKLWLASRAGELNGKRIERVFARGKNVVGLIEGEYYFYSHQMMWGRWHITRGRESVVFDRRERARIEVEGASAILMSAPIFEVGEGDPFETIEYLRDLGPDALPYDAPFDFGEFHRRLSAPVNRQRTIGDALLDQTVVAGLGNYLRAEVLFIAQVSPWIKVSELSWAQQSDIAELIWIVTRRSYLHNRTVTCEMKLRMANDASLVYVPGKDYGTRHYVFRRTNLPCLMCNTPIRQMRLESSQGYLGVKPEETGEDDEDWKGRIIYFCESCQNVDVAAKAKPRKRPAR
jgi:endonuclease VIII